MLIETTAGDLRLALNLVKPVVPGRRYATPIMGCVLLKAGAVWATDLDREIMMKFAAKTFKGEVAVPFRQLWDLLSSLPHDMDIRLQADKSGTDGVHIHFRGGRYKLSSLPAEDFPGWDPVSGLEPMPAASLEGFKIALDAVEGAVSTEETRYYLNGVCFSRDQDGVDVLVATDGHRLISHRFNHGRDDNLILPNIALAALHLLPQPSAIWAGENRMSFHYPGGEFRTKLIDGTFPDWRRVTPSYDEDTPRLTFAPLEMMAVLNRMHKMTGSGLGRAITLSAPASGEMIVVACKGMDSEECAERLDTGTASNWIGPGHERSFDVRYLKSLCRLYRQAKEVSIIGPDNRSPSRVVSDNDKVLAILMPIRAESDLIRPALMAFTNSANDTAQAERAA